MDIKEIAQEINTKYNLDITYLWNNEDVERKFAEATQLELMKNTPFWTILSGANTIKVDLNTLPSEAGTPRSVTHLNVLCHEVGHMISTMPKPQFIANLDLNYVIDFEADANRIGKEIYSQYADPDTYWNNHEDLDRMKRSYEKYTGILAV